MYNILILSFLGCSDYDLKNNGATSEGDTSNALSTNGDNQYGDDSDTDHDPPHDDSAVIDTPDLPPIFMDECDSDDIATFQGSEIYVFSWDPSTASGVIISDANGWFHVYDYSLAESGPSQTNEVSYFRIRNARRPNGEPYFNNCLSEWIVDDFDNIELQASRIYIGTFWLEAGENQLELNHYCPIQRSGYCSSFHDNNTSNSTCDSSGVNSVHFNGLGICLKRVHLPEPNVH